MSIRSNALQWLKKNYKSCEGKIYTSKYYLPEESWPKTHVWWIQIPLNVLNSVNENNINLLCQTNPNSNQYYYLKVPVKFLVDHLHKFDIVQDKMIHLTVGNLNSDEYKNRWDKLQMKAKPVK